MTWKRQERFSISKEGKIFLTNKYKPRKHSHMMWGTPIYFVWASMIQRCKNKNNPKWERYGGRGILVCKEWDIFENFYHDMGKDYKYGLTLDRINNNGNYEPGNCRWATKKQQSNNIKGNKIISFNGESRTIHEWAELLNINPKTIDSRLRVYKWTIEKTLTQPVKQYTRKVL